MQIGQVWHHTFYRDGLLSTSKRYSSLSRFPMLHTSPFISNMDLRSISCVVCPRSSSLFTITAPIIFSLPIYRAYPYLTQLFRRNGAFKSNTTHRFRIHSPDGYARRQIRQEDHRTGYQPRKRIRCRHHRSDFFHVQRPDLVKRVQAREEICRNTCIRSVMIKSSLSIAVQGSPISLSVGFRDSRRNRLSACKSKTKPNDAT